MFTQQMPSTSHNYPQANKYPDEFIQSFGSVSIPNQIEWVSARFSPHPQQEGIFAIGSEGGQIDIRNAKYPNAKKKAMASTGGVVFDFCFIPKFENWLVSLSGNSQLELWDIEKEMLMHSLIGHTNSVRCASVWPENPYLLVSGSRDGSIMYWDLRISPSIRGRRSMLYVEPSRQYKSAHGITENKQRISVTSLLHIGNESVISSYSSISCGIHQWDMRYLVTPGPVRIWDVPQRVTKKSGITCLCWDRFKSSFFAACTDNAIHEYMPSVQLALPIRTLTGQNIDTFYVQCATSPISDHLICGSSDKRAYIWDLQETRTYRRDNFDINGRKTYSKYLPNPKFALEGHELETVQWSSRGNHILTIGPESLNIWAGWAKKEKKGYPNELVLDDRPPLKLIYPTLLKQREQTDVQLEKKEITGIHSSKKVFNGNQMARSPVRILANLPAQYTGHGLSFGECKVKTSCEIVLKGNLSVTPASKIQSKVNEYSSTQKKTPKRNLTASFQKITPHGTAKKRKKRMDSHSPGIGKSKINRRSLHQPPSSSPVQSKNPTTPTILRYFSPNGNKNVQQQQQQ